MKKVLTITCHECYNAGASLQAFALQKYIEKLGCAVEIIDYKPEYLQHYKLWGMNPRFDKNSATRMAYYAIKLPGRLMRRLDKRKRNYDRFTRKYLRTTEKQYASNEELKTCCPKADVYVAGSDQIWNPVLDNGKDPAFFLGFVPDGKKRISYAGSFAVNEVPFKEQQAMKRWLSRFDAISVRELSGVDILRNMGLSGTLVVDPVFLLNADEWDKIAAHQLKGDYVLVYDFDQNPELKSFAQNLAAQINCKVYSVLKCDWADKEFSNWGPDGFVSLVKNAKAIVSNSFHATAFSIIYNIPFYVFLRTWGINARMVDLIRMAGVESRLVEKESQTFEEIEWNCVNAKMENIIDQSKLWLKGQLK